MLERGTTDVDLAALRVGSSNGASFPFCTTGMASRAPLLFLQGARGSCVYTHVHKLSSN